MPTRRLLRELLDGRYAIADRALRRVRSEMPSFESIPLEDHREEVAAALELLLRVRIDGNQPVPSEDARNLRDYGERRARQGVPVDDLMRSWRMGVEELVAYAREIAPRIGAPVDDLIDLFQEAFAVGDEAMVSIAGGHRREPGQGDPERERRAALVRGALHGRFTSEELHSGFAALGLDPLLTYRAFRARGETDEDVDRLEAQLGSDENGASRPGLAAILEHELVGFCTGEVPRGVLPVIAVGSEGLPADLPQSYRMAGRVLAAAETFGLAGIHDLASAGLHAAVIENPDMGAALSDRLIAPVLETPSGTEIVATVREWLSVGMKVDLAAERLFVHANTVRYRLRRYEELSGADLAVTEEIFRVWWAIQREEAVSRRWAAATAT